LIVISYTNIEIHLITNLECIIKKDCHFTEDLD
jgi:hypothetical protein